MSAVNISEFQGGATLPVRREKVFQTSTAPAALTAAFDTHAALTPFQQYVTIKLLGRGGKQQGVFAPGTFAAYQFLINPSEVHIQRHTIDSQSLSRRGWQIGVWGEDFIDISLAGKTPGKYFGNGLTDHFTQFTQSYRNLAALEMVFENNGYWFEGEQVMSKLHQTPNRIKMHQDVELAVGEFLWSGMFDSFDITEDADTPFLANFSLNFVAWKERFVGSTPYPDSIGGDVQRGHVPPKVTVTNTPSLSYQDTTLWEMVTNPREGGWGTS